MLFRRYLQMLENQRLGINLPPRDVPTTVLGLALGIARGELGIARVLVTCADDNVGSIRTIEKNGGILENTVRGLDGRPLRRYWIHSPR